MSEAGPEARQRSDAGDAGAPDRPSWAALARGHATQQQARRQRDRERIHRWVVHPIDTPKLLRDPLEHRVPKLSSALTVARLVLVAVALHALMLGVVFAANAVIGGDGRYAPPEHVQLRIVEPPPEPEPTPEPDPVEELAPEFEPEPEVAEPEPPAPEPERAPPPRPKPARAEPEPPAPEPEAPPQPQRRVVGLSLESTVVGGQGPSFAVGTTRMGTTDREAVDPQRATQATGNTAGKPTGAPAPGSGAGNRVATRLPTSDAPIVRPQRLSAPEPDYPPLLREQGIEGDVVLLATIGVDGGVTAVEVVRASPHPEFNEAALAAARRARYAPATRDGKPMVFSQRYTVRFRIHD